MERAIDIKVGDFIKSIYTGRIYIVFSTPIIFGTKTVYSLMSIDGNGKYYERDSLEEIQKDIYLNRKEHYVLRNLKWIGISD
ncbi:MAG: hypothetical protein ACRC28_18545 [Clostridium sp.]|uniref:hypothetical protein n=1 Tax=Clostridium sp. TaxID=1506 RepID=UPI003F3E8C79